MKKILAILIAVAMILPGCAKDNFDPEKISGTYTRTYEEEMEGEIYNFTNKITLRPDYTCTVDFQDTLDGTWDKDGNLTVNGTIDTFKIDGDKLIYKRGDDGFTCEFTKEK